MYSMTNHFFPEEKHSPYPKSKAGDELKNNKSCRGFHAVDCFECFIIVPNTLIYDIRSNSEMVIATEENCAAGFRFAALALL